MAQEVFTITSTSYTLEFSLPAYGGASKSLTKDLALFNFWVGDISVVDKGIGTKPLVLGGVELLQAGLCFPLCFDCLCFNNSLSNKVEAVWDLQNKGEEVIITRLSDTLNGVYVIKNFEFKTIKKTNVGFAWKFELEWRRGLI